MIKKFLVTSFCIAVSSLTLASHPQIINGGGWDKLTVEFDLFSGDDCDSTNPANCQRGRIPANLTADPHSIAFLNSLFKKANVNNITVTADSLTSSNNCNMIKTDGDKKILITANNKTLYCFAL